LLRYRNKNIIASRIAGSPLQKQSLLYKKQKKLKTKAKKNRAILFLFFDSVVDVEFCYTAATTKKCQFIYDLSMLCLGLGVDPTL
jgi:hypothetical protein